MADRRRANGTGKGPESYPQSSQPVNAAAVLAPPSTNGKRKAGRPRQHDRDTLGPQLCERIAEGELVRNVCTDLGIPRSAPLKWAASDPEGFGALYARAREDQAHA